jgi:hypothetical protein
MVLRTLSLTLMAAAVALTTSCVRAQSPAAPKVEQAEKSAAEPEAPATPSAEPKQLEPAVAETKSAETAPAGATPAEPAQADAKTAAVEVAQAPAAKTAPAPAKAEPAPQQPAAKEVTKADIINSTEFRRAMFEFNEWLTSQPIYTPAQVAQIKDQFNHRVAEMTAPELGYLLADLEEKMQIINTPDAREARAWMAQYLSVMSDKKRAQTLKDVPNVATMTAAQLAAEIAKIQQTRDSMDSAQAAFERGQAAQVANQIQTDRRNQQNYVNDWNTGPVAYSPYRSNSNVNERLNTTQTGTGMGFYVSPLGGVGMTFSPSSW